MREVDVMRDISRDDGIIIKEPTSLLMMTIRQMVKDRAKIAYTGLCTGYLKLGLQTDSKIKMLNIDKIDKIVLCGKLKNDIEDSYIVSVKLSFMNQKLKIYMRNKVKVQVVGLYLGDETDLLTHDYGFVKLYGIGDDSAEIKPTNQDYFDKELELFHFPIEK